MCIITNIISMNYYEYIIIAIYRIYRFNKEYVLPCWYFTLEFKIIGETDHALTII